MTEYVLSAQARDDLGKGASRRLRRQTNAVPGILYGGDQTPQPISLNGFELDKLTQEEGFFSHILTLKLAGQDVRAIVKDIQRHPAKGKPLHLDFLRISADHAINVHVPLHFLNETSCVGVKVAGGLISHLLAEVEVRCLPDKLPEHIEVDLANLNIGETLHLSNLSLAQGVELVELLHDNDLAVVNIHAPRGGAEEEVVEEAEKEKEQGAGKED